jgi:SAM-dependent methyltransferase
MNPEPGTNPDQIADRSSYWNSYYGAAGTRPAIPSQFAVFVAGELDGLHRVIDLGCGTGRDALYFSQLGHEVIGVDASDAAVEVAGTAAAELGTSARFVQSVITDPSLASRLPSSELPTLVYARFFLHALNEVEELSLLDLAQAITRSGDILATEYRTVRDSSGAKVTGKHYRRFIKPADFQANAISRDFEVEYAVEGFGHAKYKADDAYVARELFIRR